MAIRFIIEAAGQNKHVIFTDHLGSNMPDNGTTIEVGKPKDYSAEDSGDGDAYVSIEAGLTAASHKLHPTRQVKPDQTVTIYDRDV